MGIFNLRLIEKEDLPFITKIREDNETKKYLGTFVLLSKEKQEKWFDSTTNDCTKMYLIFERKNVKIGYVRISEIDYISRNMCVGGDIAVKQRGKGFSKEMYRLIFDLGFNKLNMNRLWLLVLENNKRAIHIYKKYGFVEEGRQRQAVYKNGQYMDYIMMSVLKKEYNPCCLDNL